jgi:predicted permease
MRFLLKHPGFFAVAVLTLAIGIGANTAVFSVIHTVLMRPLPYAEPDRLVLLRHHIGSLGWSDAPLPPADVIDFRERMPALSKVAATDRTFEFNLTGGGPPEVVRVASVSSNFFDVLGVNAELGRTFLPADGFEGRSRKNDHEEKMLAPADSDDEHTRIVVESMRKQADGKLVDKKKYAVELERRKLAGSKSEPAKGPDPEPNSAATTGKASGSYVAPDGAITDDGMMPSVVLSHGLWKRRFGSDLNVIGQKVVLNGAPSRVIGVMPEDFRLLMPENAGIPTAIDMWTADLIPYSVIGRNSPNANRRVLARLAPGATLAEARAQAATVSQWQRENFDYHQTGDISVDVKPMHADIVAHVRPVLLALFGAVLLVLLIACANTANLLLVQAAAREREISIRAAVGGGRRRIVRQFLTESALLAVIGGLAGLLLARWAIDLLLALRPAGLPRLETVPIDGPVLLFTAAATVVSALVFGIVPAINASRPDLNSCLKDRGACATNPGQRRLRHAIVVGEVALAMVLLVGAGLMYRSLESLEAVDLGFEPQGVLTYRISLPQVPYDDVDKRTLALAKIEAEVAALPGVKATGSTQVLPLGGQFWTSPYQVPLTAEGAARAGEADYRYVTPGFFEAFGARLLTGRLLTAEDEAKARKVVVVDRAMAARSWPGEDPVGRIVEAMTLGGPVQEWKVVGVVESIVSEGPESGGRETLYFPYSAQNAFFSMTMVVRGSGDPKKLAAPIREIVAGFDSDLPVAGIRTMESYVRDSTAAMRFVSILLAIFAAMALLLAGIGLYGVVSAIARQRTREIGVMMAFGAGRPHILARVVRRGVTLAVLGLSMGAVAALVLTRALSGLFPGIPNTDPLTYLVVGGVLLLVTILASLLPAHRAARTDPIKALRYE